MGFARAADALGVDILQNCPVSGFETRAGRIAGVATPHGVCAPGASSSTSPPLERARGTRGFALPLIAWAAGMVTEPVKPMLRSIVLSPTAHVYASQSDRGEIVIGGAADVYSSYAQRGSLAVIEISSRPPSNSSAFARLKLMRHWAGIVDISPDTTRSWARRGR